MNYQHTQLDPNPFSKYSFITFYDGFQTGESKKDLRTKGNNSTQNANIGREIFLERYPSLEDSPHAKFGTFGFRTALVTTGFMTIKI